MLVYSFNNSSVDGRIRVPVQANLFQTERCCDGGQASICSAVAEAGLVLLREPPWLMWVRAAGCGFVTSMPDYLCTSAWPSSGNGDLVEAMLAFWLHLTFVCCGNLNSYLVLCEFAMEIGQDLFCPVMETRLSCLHFKSVWPLHYSCTKLGGLTSGTIALSLN